MNILGIEILTPKKLSAMIEDLTAKPEEEEEVDDPSVLESAKFARVYNKGTAKEMLETIRLNARDAERNSKVALYLSIPHQMIYLLSLVPFTFAFSDVNQAISSVLGSLALIGMAVGLPYLCDRLILMCIRNIATRVISTWDKWKAFLVLIPATLVSVYLNVMAPGPELLKWVCGAVVAMVPMYQIIRSCRPNFVKAGADETKIRNQVADLMADNRITDEERARRTERARKAAATRAANKAAKAVVNEISEEEREARRQRGLRAAATRKANAEAAALAAARKPRRSRAKTAVVVDDLEASYAMPDAPVSPAAAP